ncbi:MAG: peptide deformylase [Elusimicrobiota bacterium]|jgi:peptide deformylase
MKPRILPIMQLGQPVLRAKALPIRQWDHPALQQLLDDMLATVQKLQGVGIAAPQVGVPCRVLWVVFKKRPVAMINPRLVAHSEEMTEDLEGCLSVPGIRGLVPRYKRVSAEYTTREGKRIRRKLEGFIARIFQHELDHLDGIVFIDRVQDTRTLMTDAEYARQATSRV